MHSFISNSKHHFLWQMFTSFICIACLYYISVAYLPKDTQGVSQWQVNILKAQEYAFTDKYYPIVMAGSSELYNVHLEELSPDAFNLAFAGHSSLTGLHIITRQKKLPEIVIIETNETLYRGIDQDILNKLSPWHSWPWGRENNRPDYILLHVKRSLAKWAKSLLHVKKSNPSAEKTRLDALKRQQENHNKLLQEERFREKVLQVKEAIDTLQQAGCRVILAEPPNDISLLNSPKTRQVNKILHETLPPAQYEWISVDWSLYVTKDGVHLTTESAKQYAEYLLDYLQKTR